MTDTLTDRLEMFRTVATMLDTPKNKTLWQDKPPQAFSDKAAQFRSMLADLEQKVRGQTAAITGAAERKAREEAELEDIAHHLGQVLAAYYHDSGLEPEAAKVDLALSSWQALRDEILIARASDVLACLEQTLAADPSGSARYGLAPDDASALRKELDDYREAARSPQLASATRKALTASLRPGFAAITAILRAMDRVILRFGRTPDGARFVAEWAAARAIIDRGHGPAQPAVPAPAPAA